MHTAFCVHQSENEYFIVERKIWDSLLVECWTCDRKVASLSHSRGDRSIFFSRVNFLRWHLFNVYSTLCYCSSIWKTPVILPKEQAAPKHTYTLDPTKLECADYAVQADCRNLLGKQTHMLTFWTQPAEPVSPFLCRSEWNLNLSLSNCLQLWCHPQPKSLFNSMSPAPVKSAILNCIESILSLYPAIPITRCSQDTDLCFCPVQNQLLQFSTRWLS